VNNRKHYIAAISAFLIWGFFPLMLKMLSDFTAGEILYFRIGFSSLLMVFIIGLFRRSEWRTDMVALKAMPSGDRNSTLWLTVAGAVLLTINWLTFIYTVNEINIRTASFSYLICPVLTAVMGYLILGERLSNIQWIAVSLCAASCVLMGIESVSELGYSVTTAFTYGLYLVLQRKNSRLGRMTILGVQMLVSFLILNLFYAFLVDEVPGSAYFYGMIIVIAGAFTVFPLFLNLFALTKIKSSTVGILMYINPLINFTIAFALFHEAVSFYQLIGYTVIAVALVVFNYPNLRKVQAVAGLS
jgi:chloramphenicol-sensitive protein RarD